VRGAQLIIRTAREDSANRGFLTQALGQKSSAKLLQLTALCHSCHNTSMAVRTTVDIPAPLHDKLRAKAEQAGTSIRALIVRAIEQTYGEKGRGAYVTGPMVRGKGRLGPRFPVDENPHDIVFS